MKSSDKTQKQQEYVRLVGIATNNLKNITVNFPLGKFSVVSGVSGSGKSSLLFDTVYGEAYRRYMESLSSYARQYLQSLPRPKIQEVHHLPPAIAVRQSRSGLTRRSTVATLSELQDLLQVLYEHLSVVTCYGCGQLLPRTSARELAEQLLHEAKQDPREVIILAPLREWSGLQPKDLLQYLQQQGFSRLYRDGTVVPLKDCPLKELLSQQVLVDRISVEAEDKNRLLTSLNLAFKLGKGVLSLVDAAGEIRRFTSKNTCLDCGITYPPSSNALFSFNHPHGACATCQGFGLSSVPDWNKVVPDHASSIAEEGLAPLNFGEHRRYYKKYAESGKKLGFDIKLPFKKYTPAQWEWLKNGDGKKFLGMEGYFAWLASKKYKMHYRIHRFKYFTYATCESCKGQRFRPETLAMTLCGKNLAQVHRMMIKEVGSWLTQVAAGGDDDGSSKGLAGKNRVIVREAIEEVHRRLSYLQRIGLGYLSLDRSATTLSGGELQRLHLARCLASSLTETLYCLDEPSSGLHARDSKNLLELLYDLRDQGNTVVVVEHERSFIDGADYLIEIGPGPGELGGELTFAGPPKQLPQRKKSAIPSAGPAPLPSTTRYLELSGATIHNLRNCSARFPLGHFSAVCGVSGSGKTSLIQHTLYPLLVRHLGQQDEEEGGVTSPVIGNLGPQKALDEIRAVHLVSQAPIGRSSRSNIITYLDIYSSIRQLLASTEEARLAGFTLGTFSFNVPGGRCETCKGLGTVSEDMSFLGEMAVECPSCQGKRFKPEVLTIKYNGLNLLEILGLTASQARQFFYGHRKIREVLDQVIALGLGYVTLGQHTSSFSGGEAQRLKLLALLTEKKNNQGMVFIFDEPTTGLADADVENLLRYFRQICQQGHTVIVVEHHLSVLRACDYLVEIGPGAADFGGRVVYQGPPQLLKKQEDSPTAPFL